MNLDIAKTASSKKVNLVDIEIPSYPKMKDGEVADKFNCVVVDTVNEMQNGEYLAMIDPSTGQLMTQKKYANLSITLKIFVDHCKKYRDPSNNGQTILILGSEGSGKSYGVKYLNPRTTMWIHTDNKPGTFRGSSSYNPKFKNYTESRDYNTAKKFLEFAYSKRDPNVPFVVFLMGHIEKIEDKNDTGYKEQLKTVGQFAHKLNIEGAVSNCFKTGISHDAQTEQSTYYFDTQNNGHNTIRSQEELFPGRFIPNNLEYVRQSIINW